MIHSDEMADFPVPDLIPSFKGVIAPEGMFWGSPLWKSMLESEVQDRLVDREIYDWISSLYWIEGAAAPYALRMMEQASQDRKADWFRVYRDEINHQMMLAAWLSERGLPPLPPSPLVKRAQQKVDAFSKAQTASDLARAIESSQIFFETLGQQILNHRLPFVRDRQLQAILYRIYTDEARHLAIGHREISLKGKDSSGRFAQSRRYFQRMFPFHLARGIVSLQPREDFQKVAREVLQNFLNQESLSVRSHIPEPIRKFEGLQGYQCVACSPKRFDGLHLQPKYDNSTGIVYDELEFQSRHEGFPGLAHGGLISTLLDELMGYAVIYGKNQLPLTKDLQMSYLQPVALRKVYRVEAQIVEESDSVFRVEGCIKDLVSGIPLTKASGRFIVPSLRLAKRILGSSADSPAIKDMFGSSGLISVSR